MDIQTDTTWFRVLLCHIWHSSLRGLIPSLYTSFLCFLLLRPFSKIGCPSCKKKRILNINEVMKLLQFNQHHNRQTVPSIMPQKVGQEAAKQMFKKGVPYRTICRMERGTACHDANRQFGPPLVLRRESQCYLPSGIQ